VEVKAVVRKKLRELGMEEYLRQNGVDLKTIQESKSTVASRVGEKMYYYDRAGEQKDVLVPISEIKGVNRLSGFTWFDILNYGATGVPKSEKLQDFNINSYSFWGVLSWLEKNTLNDVKYMYRNTDSIDFLCFKKGNSKEYYLLDEGNHRIVTAKNIGIPEVISRNVKVYEYNERKHNVYKTYKDKEKELIELMDELYFSIVPWKVSDITKTRRPMKIKFDLGGVYFIFSYEEQEIKDDFSVIEVMIHEMESLIDRLNHIKKKSRLYYHLYKMLSENVIIVVKRFMPPRTDDKYIPHVIAMENAMSNGERNNKI